MSPALDLMRIPVSAVMTRGPATVDELAPLADAAAEMAAGGFRHVPVVDSDGRLVGMVSERDLRALLGTDLHGFSGTAEAVLHERVAEVMTPDPIALPPHAALGEALAIFADDRVGAVPIVDDDERLVGIVSYVDLLGTIRLLSEAAAIHTEAARPTPAKHAAARPRPRRRAPGRRPARNAAREHPPAHR
jgi:CBS domain-containing protein